MVTEKVIQQLEALYQKLMTKDMTPDEEAQAKVQLLEILSSVKAYAEMQQGNQARAVLERTNSLKNLLLDWDPYGSAWFKEEKTLVDSVYNLLAEIKKLEIQKPATADNMVIDNLKQQIVNLEKSLKSQVQTLQAEVATIKKSVIALAKAVKEQMRTNTTPKQNKARSSIRSQQKPVAASAPSTRTKTRSQPRPVPLTAADLDHVHQKPISLPKPVPILLEGKSAESRPEPFQHSRVKPIPIPKPEPSTKPQPIPLDEVPSPSPIPLSGVDLEEPIPLDGPPERGKDKPQLFRALSSTKKEPKKKPDKEELFSLFSGGIPASSLSDELELEVDLSETGVQPTQIFPQTSQANAGPSSDPEILYQELISLEGKRYSIERSIRDLKTDRENGILSDQEYKEKLSQLLNKLQTISKRIEVIRETLD
ncbi:MAG: hypothetical protein HWN66_21560 [Candidatus Helarchaeota archaeon]|nr:hypothetical protein [Candidatus Helarchaeota archaeon]